MGNSICLLSIRSAGRRDHVDDHVGIEDNIMPAPGFCDAALHHHPGILILMSIFVTVGTTSFDSLLQGCVALEHRC